MKIKVGQIWKWKGSENNTGFKIDAIATHPCKNVEELIIIYKPLDCYVSSSFYRSESDFLEIMEFVKEPDVKKEYNIFGLTLIS